MRPRDLALAGTLSAVLLTIASYVAFGGTGLLVAVLVIQVGTFLTVLWSWRAVDRRIAQSERTLLRQVGAKGREAELKAIHEGLARTMQDQAEFVSHLQQEAIRQLGVAQEAATRRLEQHLESLDLEVAGAKEALSQAVVHERQRTVTLLERASKDVYWQLEALAALYYELRPLEALPRTRSWVASPDLLRWLYDHVRHEQPSLVVECGSGLSTVIIAYALREAGAGKVVSLEHHQDYLDVTRELLDAHGVGAWADVRYAPLEPVELEGEAWPWYALNQVPDGPIDLLFVDGPPGETRTKARYPALPLLHERVASGGAVVLDDHRRHEEQEIAESWAQRFPGFSLEVLKHEKGTAVLRRSTKGPAAWPISP